MNLKKISPEVSVSPQISAEDVASIAEEGYRAIICNRPDGEGSDQPPFEMIEAAAKKAGIEARYVPVQSGMMTEQDVSAFSDALSELESPLVAYCRSGTRSAMLYSALEAAG